MDIMIDLETMSSRPNAAVASLGAVAFDIDGTDDLETIIKADSRRFYLNVDLRSQKNRHFDPDTIYWWMEQSGQARNALTGNMFEAETACVTFRDWYKSVDGARTWAFGATFDHVVLQDLYRDMGRVNPIHYRDQLCMRTITKLVDVQADMDGLISHNALDDCMRQVVWLQRCMKALRGNPE